MYTEINNNAAQCITVSSTCSQQATLTFKQSARPFYETHIYKFPIINPKIFTFMKSVQIRTSSNIELNSIAVRVGTWTIHWFSFPILHNTPASILIGSLLFIPQKLFKKLKFKIIWFCFLIFPFSVNGSGLLWPYITYLAISNFQTHYHTTLRNVIFHKKKTQNNRSLNYISFTAPPFSVLRNSRGTHLETYSPGDKY